MTVLEHLKDCRKRIEHVLIGVPVIELLSIMSLLIPVATEEQKEAISAVLEELNLGKISESL